jgi:hypothetical protein
VVFDYIVEEARAHGIKDIRMSTRTLKTLFASTEQLGLVKNEEGTPWLSYQGNKVWLKMKKGARGFYPRVNKEQLGLVKNEEGTPWLSYQGK